MPDFSQIIFIFFFFWYDILLQDYFSFLFCLFFLSVFFIHPRTSTGRVWRGFPSQEMLSS